ncbi:hypothetical protein [Chamaesiphon sp. VAR_48_metabat_135_sub]|uniref:hypothetical protein n=1 Tax=Chamaesiphon sp. VAR_48_metabat_135_sub TaxID=2964699 RepID=UPI00286AE6C4|nr:hypothetical protein [Chamaesiphon sp. VAR_48_metabat_135_sub]
MKTMEEIDVWYELELNKAKLEGKIEIALKMIQENISLETISRITGITIDRLQQLQASQVKD